MLSTTTRNAAAAFTRAPNNNEFYTPSAYIELARDVMGGIDLDPASNDIAQRTVQATTYYTAQTDGLAQDWRGRVWLNPPYEHRLITRFADKLASSIQSGAVEQAIVLVNNAADTGWFATLAGHASSFCLKRGRIRFETVDGTPKGSPPIGQVFIYFGDRREAFRDAFAPIGHVLNPAR